MSSSQDDLKRRAAEAALHYVQRGRVLGVGTGSTIDHFITLLIEQKVEIEAAVSSSERSSAALKKGGFRVIDLNDVTDLSVYIDGADEVDPKLALTKGGGGALTREKIIAAAAQSFVCVVDESKRVPVLGKFPLPVEVIPMARAYVARELARLGGVPRHRAGFVTDNGNHILDVTGLTITDPLAMESEIGLLTGVVTVGLFARRRADVLIVGGANGVTTILPDRK
jgi:ribose 5-phosphate isomerase A